jgi:type I restriction enzyme S subunit
MLTSENFSESLPKNWVLVKFDNICEVLDRQRIPVNVSDRDDRIAGKDKNQLFPYYGATGQVGWIDDYLFEGEHILLGEDGAPFLDAFKDKAYIVNGRFWVNNHAHILKSYGSNKLLCHYLNQLDYGYFVTGTTRLKLNQASMKQIPIKVPPLPEQHKIVAKIEEVFSELDNGIESLKKAREQLKTYRQAVLKYAFEGKLTKEWRTLQRLAGNPPEPAEKLLEQIKTEREKHYQKQLEDWEKACELVRADGKKKPARPKKPKELPPLTEKELEELPVLPEGWCYCYLAYLGELARGKSKHRPRNDKKLFGGNYPFIQTGEVKAAHGIIKTYENTYNATGLAQSKLWPKGTLCITIAANIANTAFLGFSACFPDSIVGFTAYQTFIIPKFVDYFIQATREKIEAFAPATAQKNINLTTLENLLIPYCGFEEQQAIVSEIESRLSVCDKIEQTVEDSLKKAEALRQSILKKAFAGKLTRAWREKHPELITGENSAEKLLEKIKAEKALSIAGRKKPRSKKAKKK